jgi:hypothetical protein
MHFAIFFPDWNSLDSVRHVHTDLEGAALVFFALLVVCEALAHLSDDKKTERLFDKIGIVFFAIAVLAEIAAYPYGQRNDTLSERMIGSLDAKARGADSNASKALTKSETALGHASEAETKSGEAIGKAGKAQREADGAKASAERTSILAAQTADEVRKIQQDATQLGAALNNIGHEVSRQREYQEAVDLGATERRLSREQRWALDDIPPARAEIAYDLLRKGDAVTSAGAEVREREAFAQIIFLALRDHGWKVNPRISSGGSSGSSGVTLFNKWASAPDLSWVEKSPHTGVSALEWGRTAEFLEKEGTDTAVAERLAMLSAALGAKLEKDSTLDENSFRILIGDNSK